ncbi:MAG: 4-diphosphocytidyl-2-C-methyl-D-erythritol kinase [Actinomycetota bacterium]|nr:4-diphosphocytidyl-2-C-methyl-D-erythritol kinase [Actinomycetota bacterium]
MTVDTTVRIRTHAKVNLFLRVLGLRRDGFHDIETVLHGISLYDEIDIDLVGTDTVVTMELLDGLSGTLPSDEENLVGRAARALIDGLDGVYGARVHVKKGIPIAAGLGGGSGNAAGALVTLAEMWKLDVDRDRLFALAGQLGSDVPYCIDGGTALATARGDQLTPLPNIAPMWFVLGGTNHPLFTKEIYELWDSMEPPAEASVVSLTMALGAGDGAEVATLLHNDLEAPAFSLRPELAVKKQALLDAGALGASMSGSGPTLFAIAASEDHARAIAAEVADRFDWTKVVGSQGACIERL